MPKELELVSVRESYKVFKVPKKYEKIFPKGTTDINILYNGNRDIISVTGMYQNNGNTENFALEKEGIEDAANFVRKIKEIS